MFKGFQNTGQGVTATTTKPKNTFAGFPNTAFGDFNGLQGNIPSDNLVAWFNPQIVDAANGITLNGNTVSSWKDTSGTYNLIQTTAANQPTYVQNSAIYKGRNFLSFDTTDTLQINASSLGIGTNAVYTIISLYFFSVNNTQLFTAIRYNNGLGNGEYGFGTIISGIRQLFFTDTIVRSMTGVADTATLNLKGMEINRTNGLMYTHIGNVYRSAQLAISTALTDYNGGNFRLGGITSGTMTMFDTLIYNRALTREEYLSMFNYFNGIYGYV